MYYYLLQLLLLLRLGWPPYGHFMVILAFEVLPLIMPSGRPSQPQSDGRGWNGCPTSTHHHFFYPFYSHFKPLPSMPSGWPT